MTQKIALAPQVQVNKVATFRDLDQDLLKHSAFTTLDNEIDLKLLAKGGGYKSWWEIWIVFVDHVVMG